MTIRNRFKSKLKDIEKDKLLNPRFKNRFFLRPEYKEKQRKYQEDILKKVYETEEEKEHGRKFEELVKESFKTDNPDQKFRLKHIHQLGIDYTCLFLYSKKNTGKTTQMGRYLLDLRAKDPKIQVVFIRNTEAETTGLKETMNNNPNGPTMVCGDYVYWKDEYREKKGLKLPKPCGFVAYATGLGFEKGQGSEFENVGFGMWDECNSTEGGLSEEVFKRVNVFLSSIIRDKKNVKGFMFGNLLEEDNIFLSRLGVGAKTKLKIFEVHMDLDPNKPVLSRILYINTGDMYKGIEHQKGLVPQLLDSEEFEDLLYNRPGITDIKAQYEESHLENYHPLFAFAFRKKIGGVGSKTNKKAIFILYAYKVPYSMRIVIGIDLYRGGTIIRPGFNFIACYERTVQNILSFTTLVEKTDFQEMFIEPLKLHMNVGEVWFSGNGSKTIFNDMWEEKGESKFVDEQTNEI